MSAGYDLDQDWVQTICKVKSRNNTKQRKSKKCVFDVGYCIYAEFIITFLIHVSRKEGHEQRIAFVARIDISMAIGFID